MRTTETEFEDEDEDEGAHASRSFAQSMAEYPGGNKAMNRFIARKIRLPKEAKKSNIKGEVIVRFTVEADGTTSGHEIIKGIPELPELNQATLDVMKRLRRFTPAKMNGRPVRMLLSVPVKFDFKRE